MDKVRVFFYREGNTLSVWFAEPQKEHICQESDDGGGIPLEVHMV